MKASKSILMLYPSAMEIEQKCDYNLFWKNEWKRVKTDIDNFKSFIQNIILFI